MEPQEQGGGVAAAGLMSLLGLAGAVHAMSGTTGW